MEKGRADYYPSRPSRAKINEQSKLFNCEASLIRSTPHYFITGPCVGGLRGATLIGGLGGSLGGVLVSDGGLSPLGGWPVFDGGLSPLGGWPVFDGGVAPLGGLLGPVGIPIGIPIGIPTLIDGPWFSFGSLILLFLVLLSFDAQGHGAAVPIGALTPLGILNIPGRLRISGGAFSPTDCKTPARASFFKAPFKPGSYSRASSSQALAAFLYSSPSAPPISSPFFL